MEKKINPLILEIADYLKSKLSYSILTIENFRTCWKRVRSFMELNGTEYYTQDVEKQFIHNLMGERSIEKISGYEKLNYNACKMLTEFLQTGQINV